MKKIIALAIVLLLSSCTSQAQDSISSNDIGYTLVHVTLDQRGQQIGLVKFNNSTGIHLVDIYVRGAHVGRFGFGDGAGECWHAPVPTETLPVKDCNRLLQLKMSVEKIVGHRLHSSATREYLRSKLSGSGSTKPKPQQPKQPIRRGPAWTA